MGFIKDIIRQLIGSSSPRENKVEIGYWAYKQMRELRLDTDTLEDVFKHGRKVTTIVQDYQNYTISIGYKWDANKTCYVITSVRLYKREGWKKR
jgi:hypothetical protein